jgi:hypothetical protein
VVGAVVGGRDGGEHLLDVRRGSGGIGDAWGAGSGVGGGWSFNAHKDDAKCL